MEKKLGKISDFRIGQGGYNDAMFGLSFTLSFGESSACGDFKGYWQTRSEYAKYSEEEYTAFKLETWQFLQDMMRDAKVSDATKIVGTPIEATFDGNMLKGWRVLTEVL